VSEDNVENEDEENKDWIKFTNEINSLDTRKEEKQLL
jgi:hypothetical protein